MLFVWLCCVGAATFWMMRAATRQSKSDSAVFRWRGDSALKRATDRATLVLFAHPRCPCTRATLSELETIIAQSRSSARLMVVFFKPKGAPDSWIEEDGLAESARRIPGATVVADPDGAEAKRFGVSASGHILLFDAEGKQLFSGGVTALRGHVGDNDGRRAVIAILNGERPATAQTPVFGCALYDEEDAL